MKQTPIFSTNFWTGFLKQAAKEEKPQKVNLKLDLKTESKEKEEPKKKEEKPAPVTVGDDVKQEYAEQNMQGLMAKPGDAEKEKKLQQKCMGSSFLKGLYKRRPDILRRHMEDNLWLAEKYSDIINENPDVFRVGTGEWDITKTPEAAPAAPQAPAAAPEKPAKAPQNGK